MSDNKASKKAELRKKLNLKDSETTPVKAIELKTGQVKFRVRQMKGFKPGITMNVEKSKAEGWAKKGFGKIVT